MARPLRLHIPGMLYHVVARGNEKACIFADAADYRRFLTLLPEALARFGANCLAFCAMWNHYHLLLAAGDLPISRVMQQVNSSYAQHFNRRHGRVGHLLQGRFASRIVEDGAYTRAVLRYIALNPVTAGRVADPRDWPWSSYRAAMGLEPGPAFLAVERVWLAFGTADPAIGRERFAAFVRDGYHEALERALFHGSERLAGLLAPRLTPHRSARDIVYAERFAARPSLPALFDGTCDHTAVEIAAHTAFHRHGYTLSEMATLLGRDPSTIWRWIRRAAARMQGAPGEEASRSSEVDVHARIKI